MKKFIILIGVISLIILLLGVGACGSNLQPQVDELEAENAKLAEQNQLLKDIAGPLPDSLDNFFPPKAPAPVYLFEMFALSGPFEGIGNDLQQGDIQGAQANYEALKAQYQKVSEMVPEWRGMFPSEPIEALGSALNSGDPSKVGAAMGQLGQVCGSCHIVNMVKTQQKYHWADFEEVKMTDPVTGVELDYHDYMFALAGSFGGVSNDLQQGQLDNARANFQAFNQRFEVLREDGCSSDSCHGDSARTYFVDESVQNMIDQLGTALAASSPDAEVIGQLSGGIGNESCLKCHFVHLPAAQGKERLEIFEDLFK